MVSKNLFDGNRVVIHIDAIGAFITGVSPRHGEVQGWQVQPATKLSQAGSPCETRAVLAANAGVSAGASSSVRRRQVPVR